jgi:Bax protein
MNNPTTDCKSPDEKKDFSRMMLFGQLQVQHWVVYLMLICITGVLFILIRSLGTSYHVGPSFSAAVVKKLPEQESLFFSEEHGKTKDLISKLKHYGLWIIDPLQEIPRFFIKSYPADLKAVSDITIKKRVFLHTLLPHALLVRQVALNKRSRLESILSKIDCPLEDINLDDEFYPESQCLWSDYLTEEDISFIQKLSKDYRTITAEGLLERVDAIPTSIILAQGALESSWGSSRFTREGNSVFGMWTWKTKGIVPSRRDKGRTHKVKAYDDVQESVRAYHLTLNRLDSYEHFRQLRRQTDDPLIMADGLTLYSERGEAYVDDIKNVILSNNLQKYDSCSLSDSDLAEPSGHDSKATIISESDKISL